MIRLFRQKIQKTCQLYGNLALARVSPLASLFYRPAPVLRAHSPARKGGPTYFFTPAILFTVSTLRKYGLSFNSNGFSMSATISETSFATV